MKYVGMAVLLLLLAGCGGDPQPKFSPTPTVSAPSTTTAAAETPQDFLRRWVRAIDTMERSGKTGPWEVMNLPSCRNCSTVAATVRGFYAKGLRVVGSHSRVVAIDRSRNGEWHLDLMTRPTRVLDARGRVRGRFDGGAVTATVRLVRSRGSYRVADYERMGA